MNALDHHRHSIRLRGWDYTGAGAYFVTLVTHERVPLFGHIVDGRVGLSECGQIAVEEWQRTATLRTNVQLDEFVVMPNHVHAVVWIANRVAPRWPGPALAPGSLGAVIGGYKSAVARRVNALRGSPGSAVWQRNYYEHIIRNERELEAIRRYIESNPDNWLADIENPGGR